MIHLITSRNRHLYGAELELLHRARKKVFVDDLGWNLPTVNGCEYDEYDDDRAIYGVAFNMAGGIALSGRFRPTDDDRSMLVDHFRHSLYPGTPPINGPKTWEFTRALSLEVGQQRHNAQRRAAIMLTPIELALAAGAERYVGFSDVSVLPFFLTMGWKIRMLGEPVAYGQGDGVPYEVEVSAAAVADMRRAWDLPDPCYIELDPAEMHGLSVHERALEIAAQTPELAKLLPRSDSPELGAGASERRGTRSMALRERAIVRLRERQATSSMIR